MRPKQAMASATLMFLSTPDLGDSGMTSLPTADG
jgi:hypothetical protein